MGKVSSPVLWRNQIQSNCNFGFSGVDMVHGYSVYCAKGKNSFWDLEVNLNRLVYLVICWVFQPIRIVCSLHIFQVVICFQIKRKDSYKKHTINSWEIKSIVKYFQQIFSSKIGETRRCPWVQRHILVCNVNGKWGDKWDVIL